jgi:hypothetical protein
MVREFGVAGFDLDGVWRLAPIGLFAYAILRHELFDLEIRLRDAAPFVGYGVAVGLVCGSCGVGSATRSKSPPGWA